MRRDRRREKEVEERMSVNKRMRDLQMRTLVLILVAVIAAGSAIFAGT